MRKNWDNRGRRTLCLLFLTLSSLLLALCLVLPENANSGTYLDSAHGNATYGVDRTGLASFSYSKGNCAHCHEQHAMIGGSEPAPTVPTGGAQAYELFRRLFVDQTSMFCFDCHKGTGSLQSSWSRTNYSYSYWRGGDSITCPSSIYESFQFVDDNGLSIMNCTSSLGSSHLLRNLRTFMAGKVGFQVLSVRSIPAQVATILTGLRGITPALAPRPMQTCSRGMSGEMMPLRKG